MSRKELVGHFKKAQPFTKVDKFCEWVFDFYLIMNLFHLIRYVFDAIDRDGNGKIDFSEYMIAMSLQISGNLKEKLNWMFNLYDLDKSGSLEKSEMLKIIKSMYTHYITKI